MSRRESFIAKFAPRYVTFEGSIDDDKTLDEIIHYVTHVKFAQGEEQQVHIMIKNGDDTQEYFVCPSDICDSTEGTRKVIMRHRERRHRDERRKLARIPPTGRRSSDPHPSQDPPADT